MKWFGDAKRKSEAENNESYIKSLRNTNAGLRATLRLSRSASQSRGIALESLRKIAEGHEETILDLRSEIELKDRARIMAQEDEQEDGCCDCIDALTKLSEENAALKSKLALAQKWFADVKKQTPVISCAYCGKEYPEGTPTAQGTALYKHITTCDKHPLKRYIGFVKWIDWSITDTCNSGYVWRNVTPGEIKGRCEELLE